MRWARELHDETLQELAALRIALSSARKSGDAQALEQAAEEAIERATAAIAALRNLITDMRPAALDELGAGPALEALIDRTRRLSGLTITTDIDLAYEAGRETERHVPETEVAIYRLVQEGLTNAVKHAGDATVDVSITDDEEAVTIRVQRRRPRLRTRRPPRGLRAHRRARARRADRRHLAHRIGPRRRHDARSHATGAPAPGRGAAAPRRRKLRSRPRSGAD